MVRPEDGVAEKLQALVGGQPAVLVGVAAVGQRQGQQLVGQVDAERVEQGSPGSTLTPRSVLARQEHGGQLGPPRVDLSW